MFEGESVFSLFFYGNDFTDNAGNPFRKPDKDKKIGDVEYGVEKRQGHRCRFDLGGGVADSQKDAQLFNPPEKEGKDGQYPDDAEYIEDEMGEGCPFGGCISHHRRQVCRNGSTDVFP